MQINHNRKKIIAGVILILWLIPIACQTPSPGDLLPFLGTDTPTATLTPIPPTPTPTIEPTPTDTPEPSTLGNPENPLIMSFVSEALDDKARQSAEKAAADLSQISGLAIQSEISPSYGWTLKGMKQKAVHIAWLQPLPYLYAKEKNYAQVAFFIEQFGLQSYGIQFLINKDSTFKTLFDPNSNKNLAEVGNALGQFRGKIPCWVSSDSVPGYIYPLGLFKQNKIDLAEGVFLNSHTSVIRAVYVQNICDFGVTYAVSGDPRTASTIQKDLPDVLDKVVVVWMSEPAIPNMNISFNPIIPEIIQQKLLDAFNQYVSSDEGKSILSAAASTEIQGLKTADDSAYSALKTAVDASGIDMEATIGK